MGTIGTQKQGELMKLSGIGGRHGWRIIGVGNLKREKMKEMIEQKKRVCVLVAPPNEIPKRGKNSTSVLLTKKKEGFFFFSFRFVVRFGSTPVHVGLTSTPCFV